LLKVVSEVEDCWEGGCFVIPIYSSSCLSFYAFLAFEMLSYSETEGVWGFVWVWECYCYSSFYLLALRLAAACILFFNYSSCRCSYLCLSYKARFCKRWKFYSSASIISLMNLRCANSSSSSQRVTSSSISEDKSPSSSSSSSYYLALWPKTSSSESSASSSIKSFTLNFRPFCLPLCFLGFYFYFCFYFCLGLLFIEGGSSWESVWTSSVSLCYYLTYTSTIGSDLLC